MTIGQIAVIGGGTMGNGIAHACAQGGHDVRIVDVSSVMLQKALETISRNVDRQVKKGTLSEEERQKLLSHVTIATDLLRGSIGFGGVLFSDDLEMRAMDGLGGFGASALAAVRAGCDLLLVCSRADAQAEVHAALAQEIAADDGFAARCRQAARRGLALRRAFPPCPGSSDDFIELDRSQLGPLALELAAPWLKVLSAEDLLRRLSGDPLLSTVAPRDLPERQQTMNATVAWSYQLLDSDMQQALRRLGALPGRFSVGMNLMS